MRFDKVEHNQKSNVRSICLMLILKPSQKKMLILKNNNKKVGLSPSEKKKRLFPLANRMPCMSIL